MTTKVKRVVKKKKETPAKAGGVTTKLLAYTASIKVFGKAHTASGATVREAIENLQPGNARGVSVLTVAKGTNEKQKILNSTQTIRLFSPMRLVRELSLKNISMMFDL